VGRIHAEFGKEFLGFLMERAVELGIAVRVVVNGVVGREV